MRASAAGRQKTAEATLHAVGLNLSSASALYCKLSHTALILSISYAWLVQDALSKLQQREAERAKQEETTQRAVKVCA